MIEVALVLGQIGHAAFAALAWGAVAVVLCVFGYEVYAVFREFRTE